MRQNTNMFIDIIKKNIINAINIILIALIMFIDIIKKNIINAINIILIAFCNQFDAKLPVQQFTADGPIPINWLGQHSPLLATNGVKMPFTFKCADSKKALITLINTGDIPSNKNVLDDFHMLELYLNVPLLSAIASGEWNDVKNADVMLPLYKLKGWHAVKDFISADEVSRNDHFETLKWICANGGKLTYETANRVENNYFKTLIRIRENDAKLVVLGRRKRPSQYH